MQPKELTFDICEGMPNKSAIWVERVEGFEAAQERMEQVATENPDAYFIFDTRTHEVLARVDTL